jgi:hypothetical protein
VRQIWVTRLVLIMGGLLLLACVLFGLALT